MVWAPFWQDGGGQAPQIGPQPKQTFKPPSWQNFTHVFLPCYVGGAYNNFFGDDGKTFVTLGTGIAVLANPLVGGTLFGAWVAVNAFKAGAACAVTSRSVYQ